MKVAVFIASHIHYQGQNTLLIRALQSVLNQTIIPHIYISMSVADEMMEMANGLKMGINLENLTWKIHPKQMFQLQHLEYLTNTYADQYDMILFLDDDDTYTTNRVRGMQYALSLGLQHYGHSKPICIREIVDWGEGESMPEVWAYGVQPLVLRDFFDEIRERKLARYTCNVMGDCVFRAYLRHKDLNIITTDVQLYNYNKSNPFGVCNSQHLVCISRHTSKKHLKKHILHQITNYAGVAANNSNQGVFSVKELINLVKKTIDTNKYYPLIKKMCRSTQKLLDFYTELRTEWHAHNNQ